MIEGGDIRRDETAEKARFWTSGVVNARLGSTFGPEKARAAVVLARLVGDDPADPEGSDEASCRLMLDALRLSEGNLVKLGLWVDAARRDPRDLIAAAEYPGELGGGGEASRETDLDAYLSWLERG